MDRLRKLTVGSSPVLSGARRHGRQRFRPQFDHLEDRCLPSTFTVTNLLDSGAGSLRAAITQADATPGNNTINFSVTGTITLESALPSVTGNIAIQGPGAQLLTVQRDPASTSAFRIFTVDDGGSSTMRRSRSRSPA
jgi:hypothetical protein